MDEELDRFKRDIDLRTFAAAYGFETDWSRTSENSCSWAMKAQSGDKIVIARDEHSGHYVYFSVGNTFDNGTIIDFLKNRDGGNLGEIRKKLRGWLGVAPRRFVKKQGEKLPPLPKSTKDLQQAVMEYERAGFVIAAPYLKGRGLDAAITGADRFKHRFKVDKMGNILFPHYNRQGLCGFEKKNQGFTGFAKGAVKGLWASTCYKEDKILVITESAIDGLSYQVLHPDLTAARYVSIGGSMNEDQTELLKLAMCRANIEEVRLATDNDQDGDKLAAQIQDEAPEALRITRPRSKSKDWNQDLKNKLGLQNG